MSDEVYLVLNSLGEWASARIVELGDAPEIVDEKREFHARRLPRALAESFVRVQSEFLPLLAEVQQVDHVSYVQCWRLA